MLHQGRGLINIYGGDELPASGHADRFPIWFARMTEKALARWELSKLGAISEADATGKRPAAGAMWRLERLSPAEYGPPVQVTIEAEGAAALAIWARGMRQGAGALPAGVSPGGGSSPVEVAGRLVPGRASEGGREGASASDQSISTVEGGVEGVSEVAGVEVEWREDGEFGEGEGEDGG